MSEAADAGFEIIREGECNYAKPLARALLRDARISFGARGLFSFLWDLPAGWRTNTAHLALMSPLKRDGVRTLLKELEAVGAMRDEAIRGKGGRLAGRRWVLVTPERWAAESPLSIHKSPKPAPVADSTEGRKNRLSVKPIVGKSNTKVLLAKGSAIKKEAAAADFDKPQPQPTENGVVALIIKNERDSETATALIQKFGQVAVEDAVRRVVNGGMQPFTSNVCKLFGFKYKYKHGGGTRVPAKPWFLSFSAIKAKGDELGIHQVDGDDMFVNRVFLATGVTESMIHTAKIDFPN